MRPFSRLLLGLAVVACLATHGPAAAQLAASPAPNTTQAPALSAVQARQVLEVLNDPRRRQEFAATLDAIARSLPTAAPVRAGPAAPALDKAAPTDLALAPNSLGAALVVGVSGFLARVGDEATIEGLHAGANGYIVKPFTKAILEEKIHKIVQRLAAATA